MIEAPRLSAVGEEADEIESIRMTDTKTDIDLN